MNERMEIPLEYVSYQKYLWELIGAVNCRDIHHEVIGEEASERTGIRYPLLRLNVNPGAVRRICIIAGIHGNEIAGPLSLIRLFSKELFC